MHASSNGTLPSIPYIYEFLTNYIGHSLYREQDTITSFLMRGYLRFSVLAYLCGISSAQGR